MFSSLEKQIHVYGDDNVNVKKPLFINFNNFRTRARKLLSVQRKLNEKLKWSRVGCP
jgi:hypothetical protein